MAEYACSKCNAVFTVDDSVAPDVCPVCGAGGEAVSSSMCELPAGAMLGCFEIIRKIGEGNTGVVYLANQKSVEREVALKVLFRDLTVNPAVAKQFMDGVHALGQVHHPNIVCAYEAGCDQGYLYLAMQYVTGKTIEDELHEGKKYTQSNAVEIIRSVVTALQFVWDQYQICHRDIKPGNIMLNQNGIPMILDFGIALPRGTDPLQDGQIEGTPYYMSPEQIRGEKLDFTSDMYSLGATFYHMLTGHPPYDAEDMTDVLEMHCNQPFPVPSDVKLSPEVLKVLKKMMAKGSADRYASWTELLRDLPKFHPGKSAAPKKGNSGGKSFTRCIPVIKKGRSTAVTLFFGIIFPLLVLFIGGYLWTNYVDTKAKKSMETAENAYERAVCMEGNAAKTVVAFQKVLANIQRLGVNKKLEKEYYAVCQNRIAVLNFMLAEKKLSETITQAVRKNINYYFEKKHSRGRGDHQTLDAIETLKEMQKRDMAIVFIVPEYEKQRQKDLASIDMAVRDFNLEDNITLKNNKPEENSGE